MVQQNLSHKSVKVPRFFAGCSSRTGIENLLASVYNNCIMYAEGKALGPAEDSSDRRWSHGI